MPDIEKGNAPPLRFIDAQFIPQRPLLQALEIIGPAYDDESFAVRHGIARMIARPIMRSFENRNIRVDTTTGRANVREIEEALRHALAGTEFTAAVLQPDRAHRLVVIILPERWDPYRHDCSRCTALGSWSDGLRFYDLYYCAKSIPTLIARYGSEGSEYISGMGMPVLPIVEAERRARERGIL